MNKEKMKKGGGGGGGGSLPMPSTTYRSLGSMSLGSVLLVMCDSPPVGPGCRAPGEPFSPSHAKL